MSDRKRLEQAIASLESQRAELGDAIVDAALAPLLEKLASLEKTGGRPKATTARERRVVTVLFCDVTNSTALAERMDPEEWANVMDGAFKQLIEPVERHGGTVARLMGDAILAFFGAPEAHEDDPQRAVSAGLTILEQVAPYRERLKGERHLDFNVRAGINTGLVVVGEVGTELHGEYTAMGDAVNLAARMEQTARPGTLQISESTYRLVAPLFECQPLGDISVKGKNDPVRAYQVLGRKGEIRQVRGLAGQGVGSPLVGRDAEFAKARRAIEGLLAGRGGILSVIGEAGIGKSRLMAELRKDTLGENLTWLEGRTLSYGQTISYWPFQEILWSYAGINEEDGEAEAWRKLERGISALFPKNVAEILPYLASLLGLEVREAYAERVKYLDGDAMGQQVLVASRRFFRQLATVQPLVLVFEDLHWMDASSTRLIMQLLPLVEQVPLLLCGLSRRAPDAPAANLRQIVAGDFAGRYIEIELTPLSQEDSAQLMRNLVAIEGLPLQLREMILSKADGNPFFLEEIVRDLIDGGVVVLDPATGRWKATAPMETIRIPDTIQGVIIARIDRLDEEVKRVLRRAAVIGRSFLYRVLRSVAGTDADLDKHLEELQTVELIREKQRLPELEYIFKHALARDATYESILLEQRRALHAEVGRSIEILFADRLEEFYGLLAYHFAQAQSWENAQNYLLKAGDHSGRVAAGAEALVYYRQAVTVFERAFGDNWDPLQRASLYRKMGDTYYGQGDIGPSREYYYQALKIIGQAMPATMAGLLFEFLGQVLQQVLHRLWPDRFLGRGHSPDYMTLIEASHIYDRLGEVYYVLAEPIPLVYAWLRSLNLAEVAGSSPELARAYANNSITAAQFPPARFLAGLYGRLALEEAESQDDLSSLAWVLFIDGVRNLILGRWADAVNSTNQGAALNKRIGHLRWWEETWATQAVALNLRGDFENGGKIWREVHASAHERGDKQVRLWSLCGQATVALRNGDVDHANTALALLMKAKGLLAENTNAVGPDQIRVHGLLAQAHLRNGESALALQAAESAAAIISAELLPSTFYSFEGYVGPPLVYLTLWEEKEIDLLESIKKASYQDLARRACKGLRHYAWVFPFAQPRYWLFWGTFAWLSGRRRKAHDAWRKSLAHAEDLDMPYEQGLAHYEIGRHLPAGDPMWDKHLARAADLFSQLHAAWDLEKAQQALT